MSTTTTSPRLECTGLAGGYGATTAFRDVDLTLAAGTVEALLGPNGAGKTTLLLTIAGLLTAKAGEVSVDGIRLKPGRPSQTGKAGVVLVPDNRALFTDLTVEENLTVARHRGGPSPRDMLDIFPALEARLEPAGGGALRWRAADAGHGPGADPGAAGAPDRRDEHGARADDRRDPLRRRSSDIANDHGCAVLLVEQHVSLALQVADSATVLNRGAVVLRGPAADLRAETERLESAYFGSDEAAP